MSNLQPLFVDLYEGDTNGRPVDVPRLAGDSRVNGIIIKATEGTYYSPRWFTDNWVGLKGARTTSRHYGEDWFRGAYHYLKFLAPGGAQAEYYLRAIDRAGGWEFGDLWPIVDVELGGPGDSNRTASRAQVEDCVGAFAAAVRAATGRGAMLYGSGAMRDLGITSRMGCDYIWVPRYTPDLPPVTYERAGFTLDDLVLWQYCGDGVGYLKDYPTSVAGQRCDISVMVLRGGLPELKGKLWPSRPQTPTPL